MLGRCTSSTKASSTSSWSTATGGAPAQPDWSGGTVGGMSLFAQQPASATVRAHTDADVLGTTDAEFERAATQLPRIYRNLGAILSRRLTRATAAGWERGRAELSCSMRAPPTSAMPSRAAWRGIPASQHSLSPSRVRRPSSLPASRDSRRHVPGTLSPLNDASPLRAHALLTSRPSGSFGASAINDTIETSAPVMTTSSSNSLLTVQPGAARPPHPPARAACPVVQPAPRVAPCGLGDAAAAQSSRNRRIASGSATQPTGPGCLAGWAAAAGGGCWRRVGLGGADLARLKVGLVFGGSGEKGFAHRYLAGARSTRFAVDYLAEPVLARQSRPYALGADTGAEIWTCAARRLPAGAVDASVLSNPVCAARCRRRTGPSH